MHYQHLDIFQETTIAEAYHKEALRLAKTFHLVRQAERCRQRWPSRLARKVSSRMGHVLLALGRRCEQYGQAQAAPPRFNVAAES